MVSEAELADACDRSRRVCPLPCFQLRQAALEESPALSHAERVGMRQ